MFKRQRKNLSYFSREYWVQIILIVMGVLVFSRLFMLQVVQASDLNAKGIERRTSDQTIYPKRGTIFDAQGHVLALSIPVKEVYADPKTLSLLISKHQIKTSKEEIAQKIGAILEIKSQDILAKLNQNLSWVSIAHQVDINKSNEVMALKIPGIGLDDEEKRVYPMNKLAASVLGIVNMSGHGVEGLESFYDQNLFGEPGYQSQQSGASSYSIPDTIQQIAPPQPGSNLTLTLDSTIQYSLEQTLDETMSNTKAIKATAIAMDPMTGRILGMASRPTFDPNNYTDSNPEERRNLAISMTYEPGSTFKIITGSAALEEGTVTPNTHFPDPGYLRVGPRLITNADSVQEYHGDPTFADGIIVSSNVVLAQVGMKLGKDDFYTFLKAFGFGSRTGVDISGEESGLIVPKDRARDIELATMSFGQANLVTPIQLLAAISAVANGGTLYRPYIVDKITTPSGELIRENKPTVVCQVISKETASQMTNILEQVVTNGTGTLASIPGVNIAGKTGTAQKIDPKTGEYSPTDYIASFAAYAPAENPKIAILLVVDTPEGLLHQGGQVAAPMVKTILEGALEYYGIPVAKDTQSTVLTSSTNQSVRPTPKPVIPEHNTLEGGSVVPDLTGLTMRQAGETLTKNELHFDFTGSGLVCEQTPAAGKVVNKGTYVAVKFASLARTS